MADITGDSGLFYMRHSRIDYHPSQCHFA